MTEFRSIHPGAGATPTSQGATMILQPSLSSILAGIDGSGDVPVRDRTMIRSPDVAVAPWRKRLQRRRISSNVKMRQVVVA